MASKKEESTGMNRRLSAAQIAMLRSIGRGLDAFAHLRGQAEHGGGVQTRWSLHRMGLISADASELTEQGREALYTKAAPARPAERSRPAVPRDAKGEGAGSCGNRIMAHGCSWTQPKPGAP